MTLLRHSPVTAAILNPIASDGTGGVDTLMLPMHRIPLVGALFCSGPLQSHSKDILRDPVTKSILPHAYWSFTCLYCL